MLRIIIEHDGETGGNVSTGTVRVVRRKAKSRTKSKGSLRLKKRASQGAAPKEEPLAPAIARAITVAPSAPIPTTPHRPLYIGVQN